MTQGERARALARLSALARLLDACLVIPGLGVRIGLDGLIGLVPGIGDAALAIAALTIVAEGWRLGVRPLTLLRMLFNVALDFAIGAVPVIGDVFDVAWKANLMNVRLIERDLAAWGAGRGPGAGGSAGVSGSN
jgi:hypothetical protein